MDRLSSDDLFHYTKEIQVIKMILQNGFRHSLVKEKVIFKDSEQQNFMVCFCDILAKQAKYHRNYYGDIAIVLTKKWGINNNISPVRYVHKTSAGQTPDYIKIKNINRKIRANMQGKMQQYASDYLLFGLLKEDGQMTSPSIDQSANNNLDWDNHLEKLDTEYNDFLKILQNEGKEQIFSKYLVCFGNRLAELHNELELRDSFMRVYQDNFNDIKNKILYDEREWRSIADLKGISVDMYTNALNNGHLPPEFNLSFTSDDLVAILVGNQQQINEIQYFIQNNTTLLDKNKDLSKIKLFNEFKE